MPRLRTFRGNALETIAFPVGGIGTGTVSVGGRGNLRDWEIFNEPAKGLDNPYSMFFLWARRSGEGPFCKVLEGPLRAPFMDRGSYTGSYGVPPTTLAGLPRFERTTFRGEYPFAWVGLEDRDCPLDVELEAWNPMIPLDSRDSGIPVAIFSWRLSNPGETPVDAAVASTLRNMVWRTLRRSDHSQLANEYRTDDGLTGIWMTNEALPATDPRHATMCLSTPAPDVEVKVGMVGGGLWDRWHMFWDEFSEQGRITSDESRATSESGPFSGWMDSCMSVRTTVQPGATVVVPVLLTWHAPNRARDRHTLGAQPDDKVVLRNWYATQWDDAWDVARYVHRHLDPLESRTRLYHQTLFGSTLPVEVLDAASSQASTIRTNTGLRLADGTFHAFEGCSDELGCCPMNCTHVWNYEQALAHLYPDLERTMRETDFLFNTRPSGSMAFRTILPIRTEECAPGTDCCLPAEDPAISRIAGPDGLTTGPPAADGQMGCVLKTYREWLLSGDTDWLRRVWPKVREALEFAWLGDDGRGANAWDPDRDGVMEGKQHNTYDIEFYGPNTMMGSLYLAALRAAEKMAAALGHDDLAATYRSIHESGSRRTDEELWNGSWYVQHIVPPTDFPDSLRAPDGLPKYQVGPGCLSDQLLGQWFARVVGLGPLYDPDRIRTAMRSIHEHNFRQSLTSHHNVQRVFALGDEPGLLLCSWPNEGRPALPFIYSDEVWTGIEYQVAAGLIYEGCVDEALEIVRAARSRHAGSNRNPWNEPECGHHYARAMSSWSLILALSGYRYSAPEGLLAFSPRTSPERFSCFYSTGTSWGRFRQRMRDGEMEARLDVRHGEQTLRRFELSWPGSDRPSGAEVRAGRRTVEAELSFGDGPILEFLTPVTIREGQSLRVRLYSSST